MSRLAGIGSSVISWPPTVTLPSVGGMNPVTMRMVVDLPAPFGPRKPSTSPRSREKETPSTARFGPNVFTKFSTLIMSLFRLVSESTGGNSASWQPCKVLFQPAGRAGLPSQTNQIFHPFDLGLKQY